jgi:hypothetical protein
MARRYPDDHLSCSVHRYHRCRCVRWECPSRRIRLGLPGLRRRNTTPFSLAVTTFAVTFKILTLALAFGLTLCRPAR